jgi:hypothetical protein
MLRAPQHERKILTDIKPYPFVLSTVEGLRGEFFRSLLEDADDDCDARRAIAALARKLTIDRSSASSTAATVITTIPASRRCAPTSP